jgi:hypothetical protein
MGGEQRKFQALCAATRLHVYIIASSGKMESKTRKGEGLPEVGRQPLLRQREKSYLGEKSLKSFSTPLTPLLIFSMFFKWLLHVSQCAGSLEHGGSR